MIGRPWAGGEDLDPQLATAYGLLFGDGHIQRNGGRSVYIRTREPEVIAALRQTFGNRVSQVDDDRYRVQGAVDEMGAYGFDFAPLPERELPEFVNRMSVETARAFLKGLYEANGSCLAKVERVTLKATNRRTVDGVQRILIALGIPSYTTTNKPHQVKWDNGTYTSRESYDLNTVNVHEFNTQVGFIHRHKAKAAASAMKKRINPRATTVTSIEYAGEETVYDFTESITHWGWANGLKTHNCGEMPLESFEMCTLVEAFPSRAEDEDDFLATLKVAFLYGKAVTLLPTHWENTNAVMQRNRRVGTSMSGIADFSDNYGTDLVAQWMDAGYQAIQQADIELSERFAVRESIRTTTIKPSGTVSIVAGVSPGVHWAPGGAYFSRAIRFRKEDPMVTLFQAAGYRVEPASEEPIGTAVVFFPVKSAAKRSEKEVPLTEKAELATLAPEVLVGQLRLGHLVLRPRDRG